VPVKHSEKPQVENSKEKVLIKAIFFPQKALKEKGN
jgi:hypothetical protein